MHFMKQLLILCSIFIQVISISVLADDFCEQRVQSDDLLRIVFEEDVWGIQRGKNVSTHIMKRPLPFLNSVSQLNSSINKLFPNKRFDFKKIDLYFVDLDKYPAYQNYLAIFCGTDNRNDPPQFFVTEKLFVTADKFKQLLAHEMFHWMSYRSNKKFAYWLEEAIAQYFESIAYGVSYNSNHIYAHLTESPWLPLGVDIRRISASKQLISSYYGQGLLFLEYLGGSKKQQFFKALFSSSAYTDTQKLSRSFNKVHSKDLSFELLFKNFSLAKYLNFKDYSLSDDYESRKYFLGKNYPRASLKKAPSGWPEAFSSQIVPDYSESELIYNLPKDVNSYYLNKDFQSNIKDDSYFYLRIRSNR